jgi:predicted transcriptional regulator
VANAAPGPTWTFLTNHARVLITIARDPAIRLRDVASACHVTERTAQTIVADLEAAGYLTHTREGRRNLYRVTAGTHFRHDAEAEHEIAGLISLIAGPARKTSATGSGSSAGNRAGTGTARARRARQEPEQD